ncbi:putative F-box associated interaction domain, F-box-like domain superfamily [Helianthus annuus]|nr:putative F-box associated interaction domain, F-box-like domain superfamily [Helianthus annuus]KAJ0766644.1 putative F-box associated interaction domain, F-box-like domain superfamily [Helianthus annuus]
MSLGVEVIVFGILTRLPAKQATRCKIVCKDWCALLSTRAFETSHCSRSLLPCNQKTLLTRLLVCSVYPMDFKTGDYGTPTNIQFPFPPGLKGISTLAHLDGLLCISLQPTNDLVLWNPTTTKYKLLSTPTGQGLYNNVNDAVGLYKGPADDYNVLHIKRTTGVTTAHIYSRRLGTWRQIPFDTKPEYATRMFIWSHGTLCGNTLYFTITEEWDVFINVVIAFNTITEKIIEIPFPPVPPTSVYEGVLANVQDSLQMLLMTTSGGTKKKADLWTLNGDRWDNLFSTPPVTRIPFSTWVTFTHFMTNGTWYFMSGPIKLYEFATENNPLDRFYAGNWFQGDIGAIFTETLVSPTHLN